MLQKNTLTFILHIVYEETKYEFTQMSYRKIINPPVLIDYKLTKSKPYKYYPPLSSEGFFYVSSLFYIKTG